MMTRGTAGQSGKGTKGEPMFPLPLCPFVPLPLAVLALWFTSGPELLGAERPDVVIADFEGPDYGGWTATGEAFGSGPARGTLPRQMPVSGFRGHGLVNSYTGGDGTTGTLTSPPFPINRKYVNFLIGGGHHPGETCINMLLDGDVVRTATGPNDHPGGSERLEWHTWDVSEFAGKAVTLDIVDRHTGGWGHINIDHIVLSDLKFQAEPASRTLIVRRRYLHLPVKTGAPKRRMTFVVDGRTVREFDIELADKEPDVWVFSDVSAFQGQELTVQVDRLPAESAGLRSILQADDVPAAETLYRETLRPQFHFTARRGWLNDPNGLTYHDGRWHLFFQHNPYGVNWGNMHWGHAVSEDLVHWRERRIALVPQRYGDWCFSGSAVVDRENTSGLGTGTEPPIMVAYTSTGRGECIAFSNDDGRSFNDYESNPVVRHRGRDPKVIWHEPTKRWVMAVYDETDDVRGIAFYSSPNLRDWTLHSKIDGFFECPDLFELPVDGDEGKTQWVLYAADGRYLLGRFDGRQFTKEAGKHQVWYGNFYAAQTFSNAPHGRRIQIGWGRGITFPEMPFNQQMTFPVRLTLRTTKDGVRMFAEPVREIALLHGNNRTWKNELLQPGDNPLEGISGDLFDVRAEIEFGTALAVEFVVRGVPVVYDVRHHELRCENVKAPLDPENGTVRLQILVDRGSIEVFGNQGRVAMSVGVIPSDDHRSLSVVSQGGPARIRSLTVHELQSAWTARR